MMGGGGGGKRGGGLAMKGGGRLGSCVKWECNNKKTGVGNGKK